MRARISGLSVVVCGSVTREDPRVTALIADGAHTSLANAGGVEGMPACEYCQVLEKRYQEGVTGNRRMQKIMIV